LVFAVASPRIAGEEPALRLRAALSGTTQTALTIEVHRWSTDAERSPLMTALTPPPAAPAAAVPAAAAPAGRAGRAGGRGGRGAAAPLTPAERLTAAVKAAPTVGFIWGDGPTGYSIKYAWKSALPDGRERIVLVTDRRLGAHATSWPAATGLSAEALAKAGDAEFTVMEMRIDAKGIGAAKASPASPVVVDAAANTLAIENYDAAPVLLKVTR
jgi:hypothetical protein